MTRYPVGLPKPIRDDYAFSPTNRIRRTEMDSGRARQRIEFDSVPTYVPVTFIFTEPQARLFEAWADQVAGADWWIFPLVSPLAHQDEQVRFTQSPSGGELIGVDIWKFTCQLEVRYKPIFPEGWIDILPDYILYADILDYAANQEWPLWARRRLLTQGFNNLITESGDHLTEE